jgi:hypothetical protein
VTPGDVLGSVAAGFGRKLAAGDWAPPTPWYNSGMEQPFTPLPAELRPILHAQGDEPLRLFDDETHKVYVLVEQPPASALEDDQVRNLLAEADEDIASGNVAPLNMDEIKAEARRIFEERRARRETR